MAATNKCLAQSNKSLGRRKATKKQFPQMNGVAMTLQEAKSIARHLGLTLRKVRSGHYRVNFRDGNETTAYYTDRLEDAVNTAIEMARKRELRAAADPVALATR
jgi:hypothetical protein